MLLNNVLVIRDYWGISSIPTSNKINIIQKLSIVTEIMSRDEQYFIKQEQIKYFVLLTEAKKQKFIRNILISSTYQNLVRNSDLYLVATDCSDKTDKLVISQLHRGR